MTAESIERAKLVAARGPDLTIDIKMPTGAGRDLIVSNIIQSLPSTSGSIIFCTPAKSISEQLANVYTNRGYIVVRDRPWYRLTCPDERGIQIRTYQNLFTAGRKLDPDNLPDVGAMVLYDCHMASMWQIIEMIENFRPRQVIRVSNLGSK